MNTSFIALSGPTNSGKSTLLNSFANKKVSIVSKKIQTTAFNIEYSINYKKTKMIFIDTPGFYKDNISDNYLREAYQGLERADIVVFILDINNKFRHLDKIKNNLNNIEKKILVFNKIDKVNNEEILTKIKKIDFLNDFDQIFYISALKKKILKKYLITLSKIQKRIAGSLQKEFLPKNFFQK